MGWGPARTRPSDGGAPGVGSINLPVDAVGASNGSGAGNLILQFATSASAEVRVIYEYDPVVPTKESSWGRVKSNYC